MKRIIAIALFGATLTACATPTTPEPTGGNRAGGTVDESFEYGGLQKPVINWDVAQASAKERCAAWGYTGADKFGGAKTQCIYSNSYGCLRWTATVTYQCTGNGDAK